MSHIRLSPVELDVLEHAAEWHTSDELVRALFPGHPPTSVRSAIGYLRRTGLLRPLERRHGQPYLERTELGEQLLRDQRGRTLEVVA